MIQTAPSASVINPGSDAESYAENELELIRKDAQAYFLKNYLDLLSDPTYNAKIGVLSLTSNPLDDQIWGYYGGGLRGFAVGFDSTLLCESIFSEGNFVDYTDHISVSGIINTSLKAQSEAMFQKNRKWAFEKEFRFIRYLEDEARRIHIYPPEIVLEIILGPRIPQNDKEMIIETVRTRYPHAALKQMVCDYTEALIRSVPL